MAIEIVDFPINSMVDLSIAMLVHQSVLRFLDMGTKHSINVANSTMTKGNTSLHVTSQNVSLPRHKVSLSYGLSPVTTSLLWLNPNSTTDGNEEAIN